MIRSAIRGATILLACISSASQAIAHDGPPYPIFVDEAIGEWTVSIWTDPDVGTGTFFYYVEAPAGRSPQEVVVHVASQSLDELSIATESSSVGAEPNEPFQLFGEQEFAHRGTWQTTFRFELQRPQGPEVLGELSYPLEVTPPGLGRIDILWFALPFLAIGGLWLRALVAQRAHDRAVSRESARSG